MRRRERVVQLEEAELDGDVLGKKVAVLGAAFKPMTDDVRDSPALNVAARLQLGGAQVCVYDPEATDNARKLFPTLDFADTADGALRGAHVVLLLTEWREFLEIDPFQARDLVAAARLIDARNALEVTRWRDAGWTIRGLGRPRLLPASPVG
jgi:UDPglucose 6-dehydrogenase